MTPPFPTDFDSKTPRFDHQRLSLALDCLSLLRRLSGRILGHGVLPGHNIQDAMIELRDILEELSGSRAGTPPARPVIEQTQRVDIFLQSTPPPTEIFSGVALSGTQKIILGDLVLYLGKAHELLHNRRTLPLPLEETRDFLHATLEGLILLLTNVIDDDLYEPYEMPELIDRLTSTVPEPIKEPEAEGDFLADVSNLDKGREAPPDSKQSASALITDAITRALMQEGGGWKLDGSGLVEVPEGGPGASKDIANAIFGAGGIDDDAWNEVWIAENVEASTEVPGRSDKFSEEIQAIHSNEVQTLFTSIAKNFCNPLPSLLANIQTKDLASEHLEGIFGIILNIFNSAEQFGYDDLRQGLGRIRRILERCQCDPELLTAREKLEILTEYDAACVAFPGIFEPIGKAERGQRLKESIIIMEELRSIKGMGNKRITRLFAAGISNLRSFVEAHLEDFSAVSSIDRELAERILMAFRPYEVLVAPFVGEEIRSKFMREQLGHLRTEVDRLRASHNEYADESKKPKFRERRLHLRELHRQRETAMSRIRCALAVLDEFDLIESMRRIRYDKRLDFLEQYIRDQAQKIGATPPPSLPPVRVQSDQGDTNR